MSLTLLIVLITAAVAGVGFWFYNRRQINSLTETIEDKNAVISSFREHLTTPSDDDMPAHSFSQTIPVKIDPESEIIIDLRDQKKKKQRYSNRPKKNSQSQSNRTEKQSTKKNSEKNDSKKPRKKNRPQQ